MKNDKEEDNIDVDDDDNDHISVYNWIIMSFTSSKKRSFIPTMLIFNETLIK